MLFLFWKPGELKVYFIYFCILRLKPRPTFYEFLSIFVQLANTKINRVGKVMKWNSSLFKLAVENQLLQTNRTFTTGCFLLGTRDSRHKCFHILQ